MIIQTELKVLIIQNYRGIRIYSFTGKTKRKKIQQRKNVYIEEHFSNEYIIDNYKQFIKKRRNN